MRYFFSILIASTLVFFHSIVYSQEIIEYQKAIANCHVDTLKVESQGRMVLIETMDITCIIGAQLPIFKGITIDKKKVNADYFKGKVSIINFWFKGCMPCVKEIPSLNKVVKIFKGEPVNFLAIDLGDSASDIDKFINQTPFNFEQIANGGSIIRDIFIYKGSYPATLVVDQHLKIVKAFNGWPTDKITAANIKRKLIPTIRRVLKQKSV